MHFYGTNDISNLNGNAGSSDAGTMTTTGLNILNANQNIMSQSWDTGYFNNSTFYRYYVLRVTVGGGTYDWGIQRMAYYGDYY